MFDKGVIRNISFAKTNGVFVFGLFIFCGGPGHQKEEALWVLVCGYYHRQEIIAEYCVTERR